MKNILGWTTRDQAQTLVEAGLSRKTADMSLWISEGKEYIYAQEPDDPNMYACWSLGRLIELAESFDGAKVSYDDHCWQIRQGEIHSIGESLPDVFAEFLKKRKEEK